MSITVDQVNSFLDELSQAARSTEGKQSAAQLQSVVFVKLIDRINANGHKWLCKIILKDLKLGLSEKTVFKSLHPEAEELFNRCCDLGKLAAQLEKCGKTAQPLLMLDSVKLFQPLRPMLADRCMLDDKLLAKLGVPFAIETKFDGERMQIHKDGDTVRYFARKGKEWTAVFEHKLTPLVRKLVGVNSCILDGEVVAWDSVRKCWAEFGSVKTVAMSGVDFGAQVPAAGLTGDAPPAGAKVSMGRRWHGAPTDERHRLCFQIFDLLYANGNILMGLPMDERLKQLKQIVTPEKPDFDIVEQRIARTLDEVADALDGAVNSGEEGLVLKSLVSQYMPGERNCNWLKLKPDYLAGGNEDVDVLIVGCFNGRGRRGGKLWEFLCAVLDEDSVKTGKLRYHAPMHARSRVHTHHTHTQVFVLLQSRDWAVRN
jgi:DNA ligase-4